MSEYLVALKDILVVLSPIIVAYPNGAVLAKRNF